MKRYINHSVHFINENEKSNEHNELEGTHAAEFVLVRTSSLLIFSYKSAKDAKTKNHTNT